MSTIEKAMEKLGGAAEGRVPKAGAPEQDIVTPTHESAMTGLVDDANRMAEAESGVAVSGGSAPGDDLTPSRRVNLDWQHLMGMGIIKPHGEHNTHISEQMRNIKRPLLTHVNGLAASPVTHPNLIMVTSSLSGEGKTFTSINLAMSMAMEMEKSVLLIDADVAKPEVSSRLGVQAEAGFTDVLTGKKKLKDVLIKTDVPNLILLPAGHRHVKATELLASAAMRDFAEELATRYSDRIIIFDSPPLLMTTEARVLATLVGQIVVVVEESRTPQPVVKEALGMLESCEVVGLVLNKSKRPGGADYYGGYGYGYGYGYGAQ
jgi:receptor protein-tyrosine kinase